MALSSPLESSLREAIRLCLEDLHLFCLRGFVCGKGDRVGVMVDILICFPSGEGPGFLQAAGESTFAVEV